MTDTLLERLEASRLTFEVIDYAYDDDRTTDIGLHAASSLGQSQDSVAKTLVAEIDKKTPVCLVLPVHRKLDMERVAQLGAGRKARLINAEKLTKMTGFLPGGTSPLGLFDRMPVIIDKALQPLATVHVNGGQRGRVVKIAPADLQAFTGASFADITLAEPD